MKSFSFWCSIHQKCCTIWYFFKFQNTFSDFLSDMILSWTRVPCIGLLNSKILNKVCIITILLWFFHSIKDENGTFVWRGLQYFGTNVESWTTNCGGNSRWKTSKICSQPALLEGVCQLYPIHVFKLDRLYLEVAKTLLEEPELSRALKIVYLVRDPRAIHASRCAI